MLASATPDQKIKVWIDFNATMYHEVTGLTKPPALILGARGVQPPFTTSNEKREVIWCAVDLLSKDIEQAVSIAGVNKVDLYTIPEEIFDFYPLSQAESDYVRDLRSNRKSMEEVLKYYPVRAIRRVDPVLWALTYRASIEQPLAKIRVLFDTPSDASSQSVIVALNKHGLAYKDIKMESLQVIFADIPPSLGLLSELSWLPVNALLPNWASYALA